MGPEGPGLTAILYDVVAEVLKKSKGTLIAKMDVTLKEAPAMPPASKGSGVWLARIV